MLKKRLIASVIIKDGYVVQSFNYKKYLPIGKVQPVIKNLDRWCVDEIFITSIDRSQNVSGPDYSILDQIGELSINTPLTYSGGIRSVKDAIQVIKCGADRICVETIIENNYQEFKKISENVGKQSLLASMPLFLKNNKVYFYDFKNKTSKIIPSNFFNALKSHLCSEVIIKDINAHNYGDKKNFFEFKIINKINFYNNVLILDGGIDSHLTINKILSCKNVSAAVIGNSLYYNELSYQFFKKISKSKYLRKQTFNENY